MYHVDKTKGLIYRTMPTNNSPKCGWDEITMQTRWDTLIRRTQTLSETEPIWFGNPWPTRTNASLLTAWNVIAELMHLEALENGYYAFVSPSSQQGVRFELVGWMDTVKILIEPDGGILWDQYRESNAIKDNTEILEGRGLTEHYFEGGNAYSDGTLATTANGENKGVLKVSPTSALINSGRVENQGAGADHYVAAQLLRCFLKTSLEGCK